LPGHDPWEHQMVEANGINFHCVTQGKGQLVILLHGFPECWYSWRHQIPFLAQRFKVVAPDMRGYNLSEKPEGIEAYGTDKLTSDVKALIEAFGRKKAHVVGHDWGGVVAWLFAMSYPEHLYKLAVLNCPHPAVFTRSITSNPRQLLRSWYMFFFQIPRLPEAIIRSFDYYFIQRVFRDWAIDKSAFSDHDIEELKKAAAQPGALTASINYYRAMMRNYVAMRRRGDREEMGDVPRIKSPSLLIWAEDDRALGKELTYGMDPYFEDGIRVRYIPNCSHWVQQEQPLLVNQFLDEFL